MHSQKVDVCLIGKGLRNKPDEEGYNLAIIYGDKAGRKEVDEEEFWEHCGHLPTTPPFINNCDN
jgi:hypothetical protein